MKYKGTFQKWDSFRKVKPPARSTNAPEGKMRILTTQEKYATHFIGKAGIHLNIARIKTRIWRINCGKWPFLDGYLLAFGTFYSYLFGLNYRMTCLLHNFLLSLFLKNLRHLDENPVRFWYVLKVNSKNFAIMLIFFLTIVDKQNIYLSTVMKNRNDIENVPSLPLIRETEGAKFSKPRSMVEQIHHSMRRTIAKGTLHPG